MLKNSHSSCAVLFLVICCAVCDGATRQSTRDQYPPVLPIWIVEDDPMTTIFSRKDLKRDRKVGRMLVIPLYDNYRHDGGTDALAIAHPFVYEQGEDIEKHLSSFEQRKNLRRLVFWVPGYFPDGLGRTPSWTPTINGKRMAVVELQSCLGSEEREINAAMKTLLLQKDFVVGKKIILKRPPPPYSPAKMSTDSYDASQVVRSEYTGRYYYGQSAENTHIQWAFPPGTRIVNRLNTEEKKVVAIFAAEAMKKAGKRSTDTGRVQNDATSKSQQ